MGRGEEIRLLRKEIDFISDRMVRFESELDVYRLAGSRFIVNSLARYSYSHWLYLQQRRERCFDQLRELDALTDDELRSWESLLDNWLPRLRQQEEKDRAGVVWRDVDGWRVDQWLVRRLLRAGLVDVREDGHVYLSLSGRRWCEKREQRQIVEE